MSQSAQSGADPAAQRGNLERLGIAGAGTIGCGLAAAAAERGLDVILWARSDRSLARAREALGEASGVLVSRDLDALGEASLAVEAVIEEGMAEVVAGVTNSRLVDAAVPV
jgi:predicted dinucleotide-binding enzyme